MAYHVIIGLEMHCEMKSTSKVFTPSVNAFSPHANTNISEIDLAFPGTLPSVNEACVSKAIMAALILNCQIPKYMIFDRKNYYYPDLPKGYQITQNTSPVGVNGHIDINLDGKTIPVTISDIHLEEDSASLDHLTNSSLIDYNRAGVPLLECVTSPCLHSADEALAFLETMCSIYRYTGISDADTRKGQIRCDVNVNLQDDEGNFITPKVEIKNVNSLANIKDAILYEEKRQTKAYEEGNSAELIQETRRWDENLCKTVHMRSKEDAIDYKYFVDPNIPPYVITDEYIQSIAKNIPVLAGERKAKYLNDYQIDEKTANIIVKDINMANYFEECIEVGINADVAANYLVGLITSYLNKEEILINDFYLIPEYLKQITNAVKDNIISSKQAKEIFYKSLEDKKEPKEYISKDNAQVSDESTLESIIDNILSKFPDQIVLYQNGKTNMFDFFVGMVMKETKGKASPIVTKELLHKKIDK